MNTTLAIIECAIRVKGLLRAWFETSAAIMGYGSRLVTNLLSFVIGTQPLVSSPFEFEPVLEIAQIEGLRQRLKYRNHELGELESTNLRRYNLVKVFSGRSGYFILAIVAIY